jgi:predicted nucleic acid-binding protein
MSVTIAIDASIALTWLFREEATEKTIALRMQLERAPTIVPRHWYLEIANALAIAERRQRVTPAQSSEFVDLLSVIAPQVDLTSRERVFSHILALARSRRLTVYDAAYLDLAVRRKSPLATLDKELQVAATQLGVEVLGM